MMTKRFFQPVVLTGILATSFVVVWGVIAVWALGSYLAGSGQRERLLLFQADGTPLVGHFDRQYGESQYWDLEGNPVPPPDSAHMAAVNGSPLPAALSDPASDDGTAWDHRIRIRSFGDGGSPAVFWYFVSDGQPNGAGYFVGYDSKSCGCVGYMGTAGFRTSVIPSEELIPFGHATQGPQTGVLCTQYDHNPMAIPYGSALPSEGRAPRGFVSPCDVYLVGYDGRIYHADLKKRTVHVALEDLQLCSAALVLGVLDPVRGTPHRLVARTDSAALVLDDCGQLLKRYPIPGPLRGRDVHFTETTAGEALMYWRSPFDEFSTEVDYRIYWVATDGSFREAGITLPSIGELPKLRTLGAVVMPAPIVLGGFALTYGPWILFEEGLAGTYWAAVSRIVAGFWPALVIAQLLAVGLAVLCYRRQVRYHASRSERVVWPLFVLAFGLPGWVAYRFGRSWPVLESCPECGAGVPRDRGDCACCEAEFPSPALKGTEVFA